ncbi:TolC family protein [Pseudomonas sp. LS44]|uniref:TolC family protein n=1 Tax=Pseudomonas sp. LS44 TaxID=1357074 RepID=UPI00215B574C|nr:TolC family protein [Pseudomonas sp. LS44]UVE19610.1 TolC family protein [Pseudomonas sp. LS44]
MSLQTVAAQEIAIGDAMDRLRDSPKLRAGEAAINAAEGQREAATAKHFPELVLSSNHYLLDQDIEVDLGDVRQAFVDHGDAAAAARISDVTIQDRNFGSLDAIVKYPLYTGGRVSAGVEAAESAVEASREGRAHTYDELVLELVKRYYGVRVAEEALRVQTAAASSLRNHEQNAQHLEKEGQIAKVERLSADVAASEAERERSMAERNLRMARQSLASLLNGEATPPRDVAIPTVDSLPPLQRFTSGSQDNSQLKQLAATRKQAESATDAVKGAYLPAVNVLAVRSLSNYNLPEIWPQWTAGVTITLPLFDGGERRGKLHEANARLEEVGQTYEQARRDFNLLIEQRYHELENAQEQIRTLRRTRQLSDESLRAQQKAFAEGFARSLDVIDAQNTQSKVQLADLGARYSALTNYAALMVVSGQGPALEEWLRRTQEQRP